MNRRLVSAVNDNDINEVERLLSSGASPDAYDHDGKCPVLVTACDNGFSPIVQVLLKTGSNVNKTDDLGNTALMVAAHRGDASLIAMLLSAKADVNLKNKIGWTALDWAKNSNHSTVSSLLRSQCDINKANSGVTPLQMAESDYTAAAEDISPSPSPSPVYDRTSPTSRNEWNIMETAITPGKVAQPVTSVTETIGPEGGSLQADTVSLFVPEGTFSIPTRVCISTYLDEREMGLYNEEERAVSPVVQLSTPLSTEKFNKPVQVSLRPEVALKTRQGAYDTGMSLQRQPSKSEKMITVHLPHYDPPPEWIPPEERDSDPDYSGNLADFLPRTIVLKRPHPSTQIGFHIRGGKEYRSEIYISKVISDTEAEKLGLKIGDQILAVNGVSFGSLDHPEAVKILKSTSDIEMTLKYYPYGYRKTFASRKFSRRSSTPNTM